MKQGSRARRRGQCWWLAGIGHWGRAWRGGQTSGRCHRFVVYVPTFFDQYFLSLCLSTFTGEIDQCVESGQNVLT